MPKKIEVSESDVGKRLDVFLQEKLPQYTRSFIKNIIDSGDVLVDEKSVKAGLKLKKSNKIVLTERQPQKISIEPEKIDIEIVYQDSDIAVINKPQGLVVHPCSTTKSGTLVNALLYWLKDLSGINGELRPGIVHRIDKDTSGLIVVAKNDFAHVKLAEQIKNKTAKRDYLAVLEGHLKEQTGRVETYIKRDPKDRKKMAVCDSGRIAITDYKVVEDYKNCCLVMFSLQTGRTHQIRVHAKYLNHPVVGDKVYGHEQKGLNGQLLHAFRLTLVHPRTGKQMVFEAKLPDYFENYLKKQQK